MVRQVKSMDEFKQLVNTADKTVFVDFFAKWCGPCKTIAPEFERLSGQHAACIFFKVDVDEVEEAAESYDVQSLPTFIVFKNGKKVDSMVGGSKEALERFVAKHTAA